MPPGLRFIGRYGRYVIIFTSDVVRIDEEKNWRQLDTPNAKIKKLITELV
jgi:hypothetical protein